MVLQLDGFQRLEKDRVTTTAGASRMGRVLYTTYTELYDNAGADAVQR